jgi:hypothetical protein
MENIKKEELEELLGNVFYDKITGNYYKEIKGKLELIYEGKVNKKIRKNTK